MTRMTYSHSFAWHAWTVWRAKHLRPRTRRKQVTSALEISVDRAGFGSGTDRVTQRSGISFPAFFWNLEFVHSLSSCPSSYKEKKMLTILKRCNIEQTAANNCFQTISENVWTKGDICLFIHWLSCLDPALSVLVRMICNLRMSMFFYILSSFRNKIIQ